MVSVFYRELFIQSDNLLGGTVVHIHFCLCQTGVNRFLWLNALLLLLYLSVHFSQTNIVVRKHISESEPFPSVVQVLFYQVCEMFRQHVHLNLERGAGGGESEGFLIFQKDFWLKRTRFLISYRDS